MTALGVRPRVAVHCTSAADVVRAVGHARDDGLPIAARGGGHCFARRSSTDGVLVDLSGLREITVAGDGIATVGAGALLADVYATLHEHGRALPGGCGATVGIAGLTLGGGIGLVGRAYGLTCDRLVGAEVVLADGRVVECSPDREPDLLWALRGAGGGQFGVVTSFRFATVPEPLTTRFQVRCTSDLADVVARWQDWAPDAPDDVTAVLSVVAEPGKPVYAELNGATLRDADATSAVVGEFTDRPAELRGGLSYSALKASFADDAREAGDEAGDEAGVRIRSEFFDRAMTAWTIERLLAGLGQAAPARLTFTPMGGAYNRVPPAATAFAHRDQRFLLEHGSNPQSRWIDRSWAVAHEEGSGRVYPNFPDPALDDWAYAYHGDNHARLVAIKQAYDPDRLFTFPQSV